MPIPGALLDPERYNWDSDTVWTLRSNGLVGNLSMMIPLQCDQDCEKKQSSRQVLAWQHTAGAARPWGGDEESIMGDTLTLRP